MWIQQSVSCDTSTGEAADDKAHVKRVAVQKVVEVWRWWRCGSGGDGNLLKENSSKPEQAAVFVMAITGQK